MSVSNLPPKHRFLQKYSNEVKSRPLQPKANLPPCAKMAATLMIQESGENLPYSNSRPSTSTSALTLKKLYSASLEIQRRNSVSPLTPCSPSDDMPEYYMHTFPRYTSLSVSSTPATPATPATPSSPLNKSTSSNHSQIADEDNQKQVVVDEQPHCCLLGCRKPVNNRLRHSLKTYSIKDCDPEFIAKKFDKVCNFHYFRDNYLYRKQSGKSPQTPDDDINQESLESNGRKGKQSETKENLKRKRESDPFIPVKRHAGNHDEEPAKN